MGETTGKRGDRVREGQILSGKYRVEATVGMGGMGVVVSAMQLGLNRRVAIKLLPLGVDGDTRTARFEREAQAACGLSSEHAVKVIDFGRLEDGSPYLVMEHLEGSDLRSALRERGRFSLREAADCLIEAADALADAHAHGIVHRDLKPANLFLARRPDGSTQVKVLDFGLSKVLAPGPAVAGLTGVSAKLGTPAYMSPEQARSARLVDHRTDIWSLGVVLYELLSGERPFEAPTGAEILARIEHGAPRPLSALAPEVPPAVAALVERCLARDRNERVADVGALARALAPYASEAVQPIVGRIERMLALRGAAPEQSPAQPDAGDAGSRTASATASGWTSSSPGDKPPRASSPGRWLGRSLPGGLRLVRLLGQGAMGEVYEADGEAGERAAVKILLAGAVVDPRARERLLIEAKSASVLSSEHVVRVRSPVIHEVDGHPFIVMELLQGKPLDQVIASVGRLDPTAVVRIFLQVCEGLADAHAHALVHRDVKPANLYLHEVAGGEVVVKICDFGIAKIAESEAPGVGSNGLTQTWQWLGSPAYMSPEQMRDAREVDARSDLWSVCVSMYEALSGARPWPDAMSPIDVGVAIATRGVPPLLDAAPWVDPALETVVRRGLALDKASRYESAVALAEALRPFAGGEERLTSSMLRGVPEAQRQVVVPSPVQGRPAAPAEAEQSAPPWRRRAAAVTAGMLGTASVVGYVVLRRPAPEPARATTSPALTTTSTLTPAPGPSMRTPPASTTVPDPSLSGSTAAAVAAQPRAPDGVRLSYVPPRWRPSVAPPQESASAAAPPPTALTHDAPSSTVMPKTAGSTDTF